MDPVKLYISYHNDDNKSLDREKGWVDNFTHLLSMMYSQLYDTELEFCNVRGEEGFVKTRFGNTDAILFILSSNYLEDAECKEEMKQISGNYEPTRIFKALKQPIGEYKLNGLSDLASVSFYEIIRDTGEARTYEKFLNTNLEGTIWMKMMDLSESVHSSQEKGNSETVQEEKEKRLHIYLADTGNLLSIERNIIRRELNRFGFDVSPKDNIPSDLEKAKTMVVKEMKDCDLSIHLIDNKQYIGKDHSHWDLAMIQNDAAINNFSTEEKEGFSRLIWIPQLDEDEGVGLTEAEDELAFTHGAEVLQSSIEDLKSVIKNNLVLQSEDQGEITINQEGNNRVYLIYDQADKSGAESVVSGIKGEGYDVLLPSFDNDLLAVRDQHIASLKACDIAMIYYESSDSIWLRMKFLDLVKSPGLGRTKGHLPKVILHGKGKSIDRSFFDKHGTVYQEIGGSYSFLRNIQSK